MENSKLNLDAYGVTEMTRQELVKTNGGIKWLAVVLAVAYVVDNLDSFMAGYEDARK
jgi:hypothetical protein